MTDQSKSPAEQIVGVAEKLRARYVETASSVADKADPEAVVKAVLDDLEASKRHVMMTLLGLDNSWGRYEVKRDSVFADYINAKGRQTIQEWVDAALQPVLQNQKARDKFERDVQAAVRRKFEESISWNVERAIQAEALALQAAVFNKVANEYREQLGLPTKTVDQENIERY